MSLYRRPGSPYWWSKIYSGGSVVRFSTRERKKVEALCKERDRIAKMERIARLEGRFTLGTLATKFTEWKEASGRASATVDKIEEHLTVHILPFFGADMDARIIDDVGLEEYKAARMDEVSAGTVCKELSTIRQMFRYAKDVHRLVEQMPTVRNPSYRYEPKWKFLTSEQLVKLLGELANRRSPEVLPFFLLLANTGMRSGETLKLTWEMVDWPAMKLRLPGSIRKTRKPLTLDITEGGETALRMLWSKGKVGRVFSQKDFRGALKVSCKAAGVPEDLRPHDFRHTVAALMHANGTPLVVVRDQLGHSTMTMVNLYAHSFDDARTKAAQSISVMPPTLSTGETKH